jgi:hypothetical protein
MSAAITAVVGGAVVGGIISSEAQKSAAKKASKAQTATAEMGIEYQEKQLAEQQRQFDIQMEEYRRKQEMLENNYAQMQQQLLPYIQSGQGALYEQMALAGVAAPGSPIQTRQKGDFQIQPVRGPGYMETGRVGIPTGEQSEFIRPQVQPGRGLGYMETGRVGIPTGEQSEFIRPQVQPGGAILKTDAAQPEMIGIGGPMRGVFNAVNEALKQPIQEVKEVAQGLPWQPEPNVANPYAGMTGEQAQAAAIEKISASPILQELMAQGEMGILQNASATGGLRGGNVQGALAQFRPQMLQQEIERQYARLGGLSSVGQQSTLQTPTVNPGGMPVYPGIDTSVANLLGQIGSAQAAQALAEGKAQGQLWSDIGTAGGLALGTYFNRPQQQPTVSYV